MRDRKAQQPSNTTAARKPKGRVRQFEIQPGLTERLIKLCDDSNIPKSARIAYICEETGRKKQTVYRWFQAENPGSPDLESFALLCFRFQVDANWFLGLTPTQFSLPTAVDALPDGSSQSLPGIYEYALQIQQELDRIAPDHVAAMMPGDEMEPKINKGARLIIAPPADELPTNGIYLLDYKGQRLVRTLELRIGEGLVLSCENSRYQSTTFKDWAAAKKTGLSVIGEVLGWHQSTWASQGLRG